MPPPHNTTTTLALRSSSALDLAGPFIPPPPILATKLTYADGSVYEVRRMMCVCVCVCARVCGGAKLTRPTSLPFFLPANRNRRARPWTACATGMAR
jgi:hypothetical protein